MSQQNLNQIVSVTLLYFRVILCLLDEVILSVQCLPSITSGKISILRWLGSPGL
jgi:hypothetical protein